MPWSEAWTFTSWWMLALLAGDQWDGWGKESNIAPFHFPHWALFFRSPFLSQVDRIIALSRLRQSGAFLTTSEGLILQLVRDAAHPRFREVIL